MLNAQLVLEDGTVFVGNAFGHETIQIGEVIIQTGMTGYQEVLSDPAHENHIVVMTYPLIGNYGLNHDDFESITSSVRGLVVREKCNTPSNFRSTESIHSYTRANNIPAIEGIDTRKLTHHIRKHGTMKGLIAPLSIDVNEALAMMVHEADDEQQATDVSTVRPFVVPGRGKRIILVDLGAKHGILRSLTERDCHVTVVPNLYALEDIIRLQPDGMILSNGPGLASQQRDVVQVVREVMKTIPVFGIGLGHHVFAAACGAEIRKKKNGRYVTGLPVTHLASETTQFTSMYQTEEIVEKSLEHLPVEIIERIADDGSIARLQHTSYDAFSVQYYPESAPGPEEAAHLFDHFLSLCTTTHTS